MGEFNLKYDVTVSAPTLARFHRSNADFRAILGPIGGGKSVACCVEIFRRCQEQRKGVDGFRRSRWVVVRNCYDDQTEILTEARGWVLFKDLGEEDKVATRVDGKLTFEKPSFYYKAPYSGEMVTIVNEDVDLCVTPDHELLVSARKGRAKVWQEHKHAKASSIEGIGELYRMASTASWSGATGTSSFSEDWFEFLGFWFAQGYAGVYPRKGATGNHYRLCLTHKTSDSEYVEDLLARVGLPFTILQKQGCIDFKISVTGDAIKELIKELAQYGKAVSKWIPQYIKDAPQNCAKAFIKGFQRGDGVRKHDEHSVDRLYSSSPQLINDLHEMVIRSGRAARLCKCADAKDMQISEKHPVYRHQASYMLTIRQPKREYPIIRCKNWGREKYSGDVYCVTVSSHVVLVRRKGKAVWCGQTKQQLKDTTLKTWMDWFPPEQGVGYWRETDMTYYLSFGDVRAEVLFRALDAPSDVAKVLSLELTGAWLNECREIKQEIVEGLQGRLERYPSQKMGGSSYWLLIADTNPPQLGSYWWKIFENLPLEDDDPDTLVECDSFKQPSGISLEAENKQNLVSGYYDRKAKGRSKAYVNVFIKAQYALSQAGKPVYHDSFRYDRHVSKIPLPIHPHLPVIVGQDFGLTPAGLWMQMQEDGRIYVLRETPAFDMGTKRYIKTKFKPMQMTTFPSNPILVVGDPSGGRREDSDEGTSYKELREAGVLAKRAPTNDPDVRIKAFDDVFSEYPDCSPRILIDPHCKSFIRAMQTDYRYRRLKLSVDELYDDKPDKTHPCSHLVEGGQYGIMFLTSRKYDPADYTVYDEAGFNPFRNQQTYRPAQPEGY